MATKTHRWETRVDEETDTLTADAAARKGVSKSAFIAEAARAEAERTLARADTTLMPAEQFDELLASLDKADEAPNLARAAASKRRFTRR